MAAYSEGPKCAICEAPATHQVNKAVSANSLAPNDFEWRCPTHGLSAAMTLGEQCQHGSLARQCLPCELETEVARLTAEIARMKRAQG